MTDNRTTELTATERIRTMLDERSIEYREYHSQLRDSVEPTTRFYLHDSKHKPYATIETGISTCLLTFRCTPEQAIAATLGSGTCENSAKEWGEKNYYFVCSECGWNLANVRRVSIELAAEMIKTCPNCGKAVKR